MIMKTEEQVELINKAKQIEGYMKDDECSVLYEIAQTVDSDKCIVEIGSYQGRSTSALGIGSKYGKQAKVYAVDLWDLPVDRHENQYNNTRFYEKFNNNMRELELNSIVVPIQGESTEVAKMFEKESKQISLLLIDGGHRYEDVEKDFNAWYPHVVKDGFILFHDYSGQFVDIIKFVSKQESNTIDCIGLVHSLYVSRKL